MMLPDRFLNFTGTICCWFLFLTSISASGQTIQSPNYGLKSHETLELKKLVRNDTSTILYLTITNKIASGSFCADKNIYLQLPLGKKIWLQKSSGIPVCPETYQFKYIGEELPFQLIFPPLQEDIHWFDLVEQCDNSCFSILGIVSNEKLNKQLEEGYNNLDKGKYSEAANIFEALAEKFDNSALAGSIYYNLIYIYNKMNDPDHQNYWYDKLSRSNIRDKSIFLQNLEEENIRK